jgi:hypothetical protein
VRREADFVPLDEYFIHFRVWAMFAFSTQIDSLVRRAFAIPVEIIVITIS